MYVGIYYFFKFYVFKIVVSAIHDHTTVTTSTTKIIIIITIII